MLTMSDLGSEVLAIKAEDKCLYHYNYIKYYSFH